MSVSGAGHLGGPAGGEGRTPRLISPFFSRSMPSRPISIVKAESVGSLDEVVEVLDRGQGPQRVGRAGRRVV
jgi:hypothetical protein